MSVEGRSRSLPGRSDAGPVRGQGSVPVTELVAQWIERGISNSEDAGSSPAQLTNFRRKRCRRQADEQHEWSVSSLR